MAFNILLIMVLTICFITDLKVQRIYNKVIFPSFAVALCLHLFINGYSGMKVSLLGVLTGLGILILPFLLGGIGAGDVKLLALIGAIKGSTFTLFTALYMSLIGGVIGLIIIILHKETINFFKSLFWWCVGLFRGINYKLELPTTALLKKFPYGVAIIGGALICLIFNGEAII